LDKNNGFSAEKKKIPQFSLDTPHGGCYRKSIRVIVLVGGMLFTAVFWSGNAVEPQRNNLVDAAALGAMSSATPLK